MKIKYPEPNLASLHWKEKTIETGNVFRIGVYHVAEMPYLVSSEIENVEAASGSH